MRRIIIVGTAFAVLAGAAAAYAATHFNSYTASLKFSPPLAGSVAAPSPFSMEEKLTASAPAGNRAAPLTDIDVKMYGVVSDGKDFPTCSDKQIEADPSRYDKACPAGSLVATGPVHAELGPSATSSSAGETPCNPFLHVYNGGAGKIVFFFTTDATHQCAGLHTGQTAPYDATAKRVGQYLDVNVPLPPDVSNNVAGIGLYGSLVKEDLTWKRLTRKVHGKTVAYQASVACLHGKRPYTVTFTAQNYGGGSDTQTVSHSAKC